jgi:hypothetical protein
MCTGKIYKGISDPHECKHFLLVSKEMPSFVDPAKNVCWCGEGSLSCLRIGN